MTAEQSRAGSFVNAWRRASAIAFAPAVSLPSLGLAAANGTASIVARASEGLWAATGGIFGVVGEYAERASCEIADQTLALGKASLENIRISLENAAGETSGKSSGEVMADTFLSKVPRTAGLPLMAAYHAAIAATKVPAVNEALEDAWVVFSRLLDTRSSHSFVEDRTVSADTDAKIRLGFIYMAIEGPVGAVLGDVKGIVGGVAALGMGDFSWLEQGAKTYWYNMEYVYDKWLADEAQPQSDLPIGEFLASLAGAIIKRFPAGFVEALGTQDVREIAREGIEQSGEFTTLLLLYPFTAFQVTYDVAKFVSIGWLEPSDSLAYAICEAALAESELPDAEKREAAFKLRKTAGNATIEFEYYVPILIPKSGEVLPYTYRGDIFGVPEKHGTIARSVFETAAIHRAQSIVAELIQYRAFLWLYRDENVAKEKSRSEIVRKFGEDVARRLDTAERLYPLTAEQVSSLTAGGRRSAPEVRALVRCLLRDRGLLEVAQRVAGDDVACYDY